MRWLREGCGAHCGGFGVGLTRPRLGFAAVGSGMVEGSRTRAHQTENRVSVYLTRGRRGLTSRGVMSGRESIIV